jgi:hypothetical protein
MSAFDTDESFGEGDATAPVAQGKARSSLQVLKSLTGQPFAQSVKLVKYLKANDEKRATLIKACDAETLALVHQYHNDVVI